MNYQTQKGYGKGDRSTQQWKASASDVTPVASSSFLSGGQQPQNPPNRLGIVASVEGAAAVVGGVVWAINSLNDSK